MKVFDATDELLKEVSGIVFGEPLSFTDETEKFPTWTARI